MLKGQNIYLSACAALPLNTNGETRSPPTIDACGAAASTILS